VLVRMAQRARAGPLVALVACCLCFACNPQADAGDNLTLSWDLEPVPPAAGAAGVARLTIRDTEQRLVRGARLRLEGHMSHPGMAPVVAMMTERSDGTYEAPLEFTMAGDWVLVVTGDIPGVGHVTRQLEVAGVRPGS